MPKKKERINLFYTKKKKKTWVILFYFNFCLHLQERGSRITALCNYMFYYSGIRIHSFIMIITQSDPDYL